MERRFRTLWDRLAKSKPSDAPHSSWPRFLASATHAINCAYSATRRASPFELVFGVTPRHPVDNLLKPLSPNSSPEVRNIIVEQREIMSTMNELAREGLTKSRATAAAEIIKRRIDITLSKGDRVLVGVKQRVQTTFRNSAGDLAYSPKIEQMINIGPFTVLEKHTPLRYYLADFTGKRLKHSFHLNRLRLWHDALLTPTSVGELLIKNAQDSEIAKLVDTLYSKHYNVYTLQEADPANEIIHNNDKINYPDPTGGDSANKGASSKDQQLDSDSDEEANLGPSADPSVAYREDLKRLSSNSNRTTRSGQQYAPVRKFQKEKKRDVTGHRK